MEKEIQRVLTVLDKGGIIIYPTDTIWGVGCKATDEKAIEKIYKLKQRSTSKSMIVLVRDYFQLEQIITEVPDLAKDLIEESDKPLTLVLDNPKNVAKNLIASDHSLAIRVVKDLFCRELIKKLNSPLVSTSANISGESSPAIFSQISMHILNGVDYIVNLRQNESVKRQSSTIIRLKNSGEIKILRK